MSRISSTTCATSTAVSKQPGKPISVSELLAQMRRAAREAQRVVFIGHVAFDPNAKVVQAGNLTIVCATPYWWNRFIYDATLGHVLSVDPAKVANMAFKGTPVRMLQDYRRDPDWPIILEAIIRLNLLDEKAVFS